MDWHISLLTIVRFPASSKKYDVVRKSFIITLTLIHTNVDLNQAEWSKKYDRLREIGEQKNSNFKFGSRLRHELSGQFFVLILQQGMPPEASSL